MKSDESGEIMTVPEAAAFLRVGKNAVYDLVARGRSRIGGWGGRSGFRGPRFWLGWVRPRVRPWSSGRCSRERGARDARETRQADREVVLPVHGDNTKGAEVGVRDARQSRESVRALAVNEERSRRGRADRAGESVRAAGGAEGRSSSLGTDVRRVRRDVLHAADADDRQQEEEQAGDAER